MRTLNRYLLPLALASFLFGTGCQGFGWGDDDDDATDPGDDDASEPGDDDDDSPAPVEDEVTLDLTGGPVYFSAEDGEVVTVDDPADSTAWDLRFDGAYINLNGGESGPGEAWGFGPVLVGESEYEGFTDHEDVTIQFQFTDEFESALTDWYYYAGPPTHTIYSKFHVYAIESGDDLYKVQVVSYYGDLNGSPTSALINFVWSPIDGDAQNYVTLDARAGGSRADEDDPENKYTYFSFATNAEVELTDEEAASSTAWDLAFKRYYVKLNGGMSGPGSVAGIDLHAGRQESIDDIKGYDAEEQLAEFVAADSGDVNGTMLEDRIGSIVQDSYVSGTGGRLEPSGNVYVIVGADGSTYYKFLVTSLVLDAGGNPTAVTFRMAEID